MLRHVPTRGEAHGDGEPALLRVVEALVQRLLGVGQMPQRGSARGQCIRAIAQPLGCIDGPPGGAARRARRSLPMSRSACSTAGQFFSCSGVSLSAVLSAAMRASVNAAMSSAVSRAWCGRSDGTGCWAKASVEPAIVSRVGATLQDTGTRARAGNSLYRDHARRARADEAVYATSKPTAQDSANAQHGVAQKWRTSGALGDPWRMRGVCSVEQLDRRFVWPRRPWLWCRAACDGRPDDPWCSP